MLTYPNIDPVAVHLGPVSIHWYGLMYLLGFVCCWAVCVARVRRDPGRGYTVDQISDMLFYTALGIILGGRIGYVVFYDWSDFTAHPWLIFAIWKGGMSFHGGLIGVILALWFYAHQTGKRLLEVTDFAAPAVPLGLAAGRIGNFINGELWGKVTDLPWGMVFPHAGPYPRHPSQLYEFFLEGVVMFTVLWWYSAKPRPRGAVSGLFLVLYGVFRFGIEFVRLPDAQIGYLAFGWLTEGQVLSFPMIIVGLLIMVVAYRSKQRCNNI
jgi:phosphatidylglycerol:prolipoprotein diacylglycerol transferase